MSVLNAEATQTAAEQGIARVEQNTNAAWRGVAFEAGIEVAHKFARLTADQIWEELDTYDNVPPVHNKSALGPVIRDLVSCGFLGKTADFERSVRPATHGKPLPIWTSLVYEVPK